MEAYKQCVYNPVELEVFQLPSYHDLITCKPQEKTNKNEKNPFWQFLFGEKKCKNCLLKKSDCFCSDKKKKPAIKLQTQGYAKGGCEDKPFISATSNGAQTTGNFPAKCGLPFIQRGWGCHLYFCIDNQRKKSQIRNRKIMYRSNEKINNVSSPNCIKRSSPSGGHTKVTIFCENSSQDLNTELALPRTEYTYTNLTKAETLLSKMPNVTRNSSDHYIINRPTNDKNENEGNIDNNYSDSNPISYDAVKYNAGNTGTGKRNPLLININSKYTFEDKKEIDRQDLLEGQIEKAVKGNLKKTFNEDKTIYTIGSTATNTIFTNYRHMDAINQHTEPPRNDKDKYAENNDKPLSILKKNSGKNFVFPASNTTNTSVYIFKSDAKYADEEQSRKKLLQETLVKGSDEESVLTNYAKQKSRRRTSTKSGFARNSLISLRQRRQSQVDNTMNIILEKLDQIEDKIDSLEKRCDSKDNSVTMGISCNKKQSTISIKFQKREKDKQTQQIIEPRRPSKGSYTKKLNIQSKDENIYITAPKELAVTKGKNVDGPKAVDLDAHDIVTHNNQPRTLVCKNPRVLIERRQSSTSGKGPVIYDKWRRVSEELKISQGETKSSCCYE